MMPYHPLSFWHQKLRYLLLRPFYLHAFKNLELAPQVSSDEED